jgi:hypothetical protein
MYELDSLTLDSVPDFAPSCVLHLDPEWQLLMRARLLRAPTIARNLYGNDSMDTAEDWLYCSDFSGPS